MDMTTLAAVQESVKALFGLARVATAATVDHEVKARLIEIQAGILDAQSKLGDAQAERLELLAEVAELRGKVREFQAAKAALDAYDLHEIEPGKFLYRYNGGGKGEVAHYACPTCHNAGAVTVLQSSKTGAIQSRYSCGACRFRIFVGPDDPPSRINYDPYTRF
jgi:hypothetical protein